MSDLPSAVLFSCTMNSVRSPMAESIMKFLHGHQVYVDSAGVRSTEVDGFVIAVMDEIGIDNYFDLVITLSPEAQHRSVELTRVMACEIEFWNTMDPSLVESEDRETKLEAYRAVRDQLMARIKARFPLQSVADT
jgi:protein-tyrosine-phosphatase